MLSQYERRRPYLKDTDGVLMPRAGNIPRPHKSLPPPRAEGGPLRALRYGLR